MDNENEKSPDGDWIWIVARQENTIVSENILGQTDEKAQIAYVPAFRDKDTAQQSFRYLALERGVKYEPQAVLMDDLKQYAGQNGYVIFILDDEGKVLDKL